AVIGSVRYARTVVEEPPECAGVRHRAVVRAGPIGIALAAEWHGLERKYVAGTGLAAHPAVHVRRPAVADTVVVHVVVQAPARGICAAGSAAVLTASGRKRREGAARRAVGAAVTRLAHLTDAVPADGRQGGGRRDGAGRGRCGRGGAADVRRAAAAAGLREGARATVEGTAAAIGNHPAVRAHGGTCGGGAA